MELTESAPVNASGAISADGKYFLTGGWKEDLFNLWDLSSGTQVRTFETAGGALSGIPVAFTPDSKHVICGGSELKIWDLSSGRAVRRIADTSTSAIAVSSDGSKIVALGRKSFGGLNVTVYDLKTGSIIREFGGHVGNAHRVALSPDGRFVLTGHVGGRQGSVLSAAFGRKDLMILWDVENGSVIKEFEWSSTAFSTAVNSVALSPDGRYALSGGMDGTIRKWDVHSGTERLRLRGHTTLGGVSYVAFSQDGRYIFSGGADSYVKVWDTATGAQIKEFKASFGGSGIQFVGLSPDGRRIISMGGDSSVRIFNFATGEEIAVMIGFERGEWLAITSDGYYSASERGAQFLKLTFEGREYAIDQFYDVFYRPDIVAAKLRGENIKDLITLSMRDATKNPPPVVDILPLKNTNMSRVRVCYNVRGAGGGIGEVRLFHNGKLIESDGYYREMAGSPGKAHPSALDGMAIYSDMRGVSVVRSRVDPAPVLSGKAKGELFSDCREVEAIPGNNEVSVTAFNAGNTVQSYIKTVSFHSKVKAEDPHLYILSVGIDQYRDKSITLRYAAKDAKDLEEKLKAQSATLYPPENIHHSLLTDTRATKISLSGKIEELARKIKPQDSFILFAAGHGVLLQNQYYMLTHDFSGRVDSGSMLSSNEIVEMSKKIKSLSQLFILDTCHAGGVDYIVSGLYDARMSVLAKKMGLHIYASASDRQAALDGYKGNGLFTHALLNGLSNNKEADRNGAGEVSIVGLGEYSRKMTTSISRQLGHEQTPRIINFGKDSPIYKFP